MPYQPNYCNHCGERIERIEWKLWTSSRFCENCEGAFRKTEWIPRIGAGIALLVGLFGFGSYLKTPEKPLSLSNSQLTVSVSNKTQSVKNEQVAVNTNTQNSSVKPIAETNKGLQSQTKNGLAEKPVTPQIQPENPQIVESEPVYFCGAQTKKGTPCTRKVKGGGRCWQHTGLPATLPKEKLVASQ
ncbi:MAG: hypothetical protein AAB336_06415 [Acidobacteriota bacterium]